MPNIGAPEIIIIAVVLILLFGWKRLPDAARSVGRSMRIFKSEVSEMKNDGKSAASSDTVRGEAVRDEAVKEDVPRTDKQPGAGSTGSTGTGGPTGTSGPIS